jgi:hypothetical protein
MKLRVLLATMSAVLLVVPAVFAETTPSMSISGDVETNTTAEFLDNGDNNTTSMANDGRTHIKFEGRVDSDTGWFAYAKGDAMIDASATTGVDDAYVEFGTEAFSFLIGRYEAPGAFGKGQDTYIAEAPGAPGRYQADYARGRFSGVNNMALKFGDSGFELGVIVGGLDEGTIYGVTTDPDTGVSTPGVVEIEQATNGYGVRPHYTLSTDTMTIKVAAEYLALMPKDTDASDAELNQMGGGVNVEGSYGTVTTGASFAYGQITGKDDAGVDLYDQTTMSSFLYATMSVGETDSFGLAGGYTLLDVDTVTEDNMFELFASYNHKLPVEGLWIKFAGSYAGSTQEPDGGSSVDTSAFGLRMRVNYDF